MTRSIFRRNLQVHLRNDRGIALIMVLLVVALSTILVTQLTYTGTLDMRLHLISKRSIEAEYLLKSAINFGRAIIKEDTSPEDAQQDTWGQFRDGLPIPNDVIQVDDPSVRVELEIRPEESKMPLRALIDNNDVDKKWRDAFLRLFQALGFDNDNERDTSGYFDGRVFSSEEMVANLIDYIDRDEETYRADDFVSGIEGDIPDNSFENRNIRWIGELYSVPGFTTQRIRILTPFVTSFGKGQQININLAPSVVIESLHDEIGSDEVEAIVAFRNTTAFDDVNKVDELTAILGQDTMRDLNSMIGVQSRWFQILAKVDYGSSSMFMRAFVVQQEDGELPITRISEIFN